MPEEAHHEEHGHMSMKGYTAVLGVLVVGTIVTYLASLVDFGGYANIAVALAIACVKATFVLIFFMHLKEASKLIRLIVICAFTFLAILLTFLISDIEGRKWMPNEQGWIHESQVSR
jgi:cytochrome c oxidase subunit 4